MAVLWLALHGGCLCLFTTVICINWWLDKSSSSVVLLFLFILCLCRWLSLLSVACCVFKSVRLHFSVTLELLHSRLNMLNLCRGGSRICQGADHGERGARAYDGGMGSELPAGSRGKAPGGVQRGEASLKLKAFCPFSYKEGPKDKDLNETI